MHLIEPLEHIYGAARVSLDALYSFLYAFKNRRYGSLIKLFDMFSIYTFCNYKKNIYIFCSSPTFFLRITNTCPEKEEDISYMYHEPGRLLVGLDVPTSILLRCLAQKTSRVGLKVGFGILLQIMIHCAPSFVSTSFILSNLSHSLSYLLRVFVGERI